MTDKKINAQMFNKIIERIGDKELPENVIEFQKLIHDYDKKLIGPKQAKINSSSFTGYDTLNLLLKNYCSSCNQKKDCNWNYDVRSAAGNNYPFWLDTWPVINFPLNKTDSWHKDGKVVMCTHYQSDELSKQGINSVQQPLTKLIKIIEEKQNNFKK